MSLPSVGEFAPDFVLPGPDGAMIRLSSYQGRSHVLLAFYPFDFSGICSLQLPGLQDQLKQFTDLETEVFGISTDSPHSHKAFAAELGLDFLLLSDFFGKSVSDTYGVLRPEGFCERASFIIDKVGIIQYAKIHEIGQVPDVEEILQVLENLSQDNHD